MKIEDIRTILVVGSGAMGREIALQCAMHGYEVVMYDLLPNALSEAKAWQHDKLLELVQEGRVTLGSVESIYNRIDATGDLALAARTADLVSESVREQLEDKRSLWTALGPLCPEHTIFTTNSSFIAPSQLADTSGRPRKFAALHFHKNVWHSNVADIMPHAGTSPETTELLVAFARQIDQIPIVVRNEEYGYVFNALFHTLMFAALTLVEKEVACAEDIDRTWMVVMKTSPGLFGLMDMIGLDVLRDSGRYINLKNPDPQKERCIAYLDKLIEAGRLGEKSGRGFYSYPDPAYKQEDFLTRGLQNLNQQET